MSTENCQICFKAQFKYTCPRCNIIYCSVACYKAEQHLKCSEEFYKQCIQDELTSTPANKSKEDIRKIYDILRRIQEADAGFQPHDFENDELIDSDDDELSPLNDQGLDENDNEDDELDLAERLKDVDINDADTVWECLTSREREEFKNMLKTGDIMKLVPAYVPWWLRKPTTSKIVEIGKESDDDSSLPPIMNNIPKFSAICQKDPSPCLHYNLWNILSAYTCMIRFFGGEHLMNPHEACVYLVNLSLCLKFGTNFEDVEDAIISVEMEALTTGNGAIQLMPAGSGKNPFVEDREQLQADARAIMASHRFKLAAISDILTTFSLTKKILKHPKKQDTEFQKAFALTGGLEVLTRQKVQCLIKKFEFYISYIKSRDNGRIKRLHK
uniref:HIT-type domain-containing protein n=1 Tax=Glossina morsitans morsitans TaxID=37546 RepID=A0A1B0FNQ9_GLOMM